ncbi:hypothetical protein G6F56_007270 [Rhizopus delemar]|nr:hypothetical protein G6F56_007270 [Rhizopus delemar]
MERSFSATASNSSHTPPFNLPQTTFGVRYNNDGSPVDFLYDSINTTENATTATSTPTYTATNNHQTPSTTSSSSLDTDYVQNMKNELEHTKQLLRQYQHRTEQLVELVTKQTQKIADLREELKIAQEKAPE